MPASLACAHTASRAMWLGEWVGGQPGGDQQRRRAHRDRLVLPDRRRDRDLPAARTTSAAGGGRSSRIRSSPGCGHGPRRSPTRDRRNAPRRTDGVLWKVLKINWLAKPSRSRARPRSSAMKLPVAAKFLRRHDLGRFLLDVVRRAMAGGERLERLVDVAKLLDAGRRSGEVR